MVMLYDNWEYKNRSRNKNVSTIEQYGHVVKCIVLYKVVLTFKSVDETLVKHDHSNESY